MYVSVNCSIPKKLSNCSDPKKLNDKVLQGQNSSTYSTYRRRENKRPKHYSFSANGLGSVAKDDLQSWK